MEAGFLIFFGDLCRRWFRILFLPFQFFARRIIFFSIFHRYLAGLLLLGQFFQKVSTAIAWVNVATNQNGASSGPEKSFLLLGNITFFWNDRSTLCFLVRPFLSRKHEVKIELIVLWMTGENGQTIAGECFLQGNVGNSWVVMFLGEQSKISLAC